MRVITVFIASVATSFALNAVADASEISGNSGRSEIVNGMGLLPWNIQSSQLGSPVKAGQPAAPHWTAAIGTARAAATERRGKASQPIAPATAQQYPKANWTSVIGTGSATAFKQ
jgi:hypothetical protein